MWWEKVAIGGANVAGRSGARTSPQHQLVAHEFSVIFPDQPGSRSEPGIGRVRAGRPLPNVAEHLMSGAYCGLRMEDEIVQKRPLAGASFRRDLPFLLGRQA